MSEKKKSRENGIIVLVLLAFAVPVIIVAFAFYRHDIYIGGPNTILTMDMGAQYMPFWASLRNIGSSDNSMFFNMSGALGNNFYGFAYYTFAPLTWITALFPLELLPDVIYALTLIRIGLCGASFCCYLLYTFRNKRYNVAIFLLSVCYALMSYNIGYSINLMWLDAVIMLPWILMGIEIRLSENKPIVFIISVFFSLICNYYITFMSAVFCVGYLFIRLTETKKWSVKVLFSFILYAIIGVGMAAPILVPGVMALTNGKLSETSKAYTSVFRYRFIELAGQLLSGRYDTVFDDGLPLIYCGTATLVLALCYFIKGKDNRINKLLWLFYIAFYIFTMSFIPFDRAMHGFKETTCFEVRYSYVFSCMLLIIAYRGVEAFVELSGKLISSRWIICAVGCAFVLIELYMNSSILISGLMIETHYSPRMEYDTNLRLKKELLACIEGDDAFYRVSDSGPYTLNDGAWLGYNGIGYFSSCYNLAVMDFLGSLGEDQAYHILKDRKRTPLVESLFGARYRISYDDWEQYENTIASNGLYKISENKQALSLGFMIKQDVDSGKLQWGKNAITNQNTFVKELSGFREDVFVELKKTKYEEIPSDKYMSHVRFTVDTTKDASIWVYCEPPEGFRNIYRFENNDASTKLLVDGYDIGEFYDDDSNASFMISLGRYVAGQQIEIEVLSNADYKEFHIAYFDEDVYREIINSLKQNMLDITEHGSGHFLGRIDAGDGGNMLLTLPVMDGWRVKVDGVDTDTGSYRGVLVIVPLSAGEHEIDIRFISPGFYMGLCVGVISLCGFIVVIYRNRK